MNETQERPILQRIADRVMFEQGLLPHFTPEVLAELSTIETRRIQPKLQKDLTKILWSSIDNDDSRDLDQLSAAEVLSGERIKIYVAIADVDAFVVKDSVIDKHARQNTASVYTSAKIYPMLPERLSTDLTSLNLDENRAAMVIEMTFTRAGKLESSDVYPALVRNHAKLAYGSVGAWFLGTGQIPGAVAAVPGLEKNLRAQDLIAQTLKENRHVLGALSLQSLEARPVFDHGKIESLEVQQQNRATELIEDFMIAANGVSARFLAQKNFPSIRRIVRTPQRWDKIVELAKEHGTDLPAIPNPKSLEHFLLKEKAADALRYPDISLAVVKLLGRGEYVAEKPGAISEGHFGLAIKDYAHSTAPNRRYTDLVTQRLLRAAAQGIACPYSMNELTELSAHCSAQEEAINKVERQVSKSAAALLFQSKIGEQFSAIVTGKNPKGTWLRLVDHPVDGQLGRGRDQVEVGNEVQVKLVAVDVARGFIDFDKV